MACFLPHPYGPLFKNRHLQLCLLLTNLRPWFPQWPFLPFMNRHIFRGVSVYCGLKSIWRVGRTPFKSGADEGKRLGLAIAIFNCRRMFYQLRIQSPSSPGIFCNILCYVSFETVEKVSKWRILAILALLKINYLQATQNYKIAGLKVFRQSLLKGCFWHLPSEYDTSKRSRQFWPENRGILGRQFPLTSFPLTNFVNFLYFSSILPNSHIIKLP